MSALTKALIQFHKDVGVIEKNAKAQYGKFSDLCGVLSTVTPALLKNDLVLTQEFLEDSLITTLRHTSGEFINSTSKLIIPQGRNELHSWGASVTYSRRYHICSILGIVADMDTDGAMLEEPAKATPTAKPAGKKTVAKKAAPAKPADPADAPLTSDERDLTLALLKETFASEGGADKIKQLTTKFREAFPSAADLPLSQAITTQAHVAFINDKL